MPKQCWLMRHGYRLYSVYIIYILYLYISLIFLCLFQPEGPSPDLTRSMEEDSLVDGPLISADALHSAIRREFQSVPTSGHAGLLSVLHVWYAHIYTHARTHALYTFTFFFLIGKQNNLWFLKTTVNFGAKSSITMFKQNVE